MLSANNLRTTKAAIPAWRGGSDLQLTLLMCFIILAGAALRLYGLDRTSIWLDEATSWDEARRPFWSMIRATANETFPPLHNIILYGVMGLFGDSAVALRLPSVILGIANIYLLYRLGAVLWDQMTGVFAATLLAISGFHLWYSQEARMYSLFALAATAYVLGSVNFLRQPNRLSAALCAAAGVALLYSHPYGTLVWVSVNAAIAIILYRGGDWTAARGRDWATNQGLTGLLFLPWAILLLRQARRVVHSFWIPFPTPDRLYSIANSIADGTTVLGCFLVLLPLSFLAVSANAVPGCGIVEPAFRGPFARVSFELDAGWQNVVLLSWLLVPFLFGYAVSTIGRPILVDRYLIGSLPALMLLAGRGLRVLSWSRFVLASAVATVLACSVPNLHFDLTNKLREDDRAAVAAFARNAHKSDLVVFLQPYMSIPFNYYFRAPVRPPVVIRNAELDDVNWPGADRVWLFIREQNAGESAKLFERIGRSYSREQEFQFFRVALYLYIRPSGHNPPGSWVDGHAP
jgi:mannosyltransferase